MITINVALQTFLHQEIQHWRGHETEISVMLGPPFVKVVTAFCMTVLLSLPLSVTESLAQLSNLGQTRHAPKAKAPQRSVKAPSSRTGRAVAPRAGRVVTPRAVRRAVPGRAVTQRKATATRRTGRVVTQRKAAVTPRARRIVTPSRAKGAPNAVAPRIVRQAIRKAPASPALVNKGTRQNPGRYKPANVHHDPARKAGRAGWMHRHQPFFFKHGDHRWRRYYYSFLVDGLWYWYWYDVSADGDPAAIVYSVLPVCELDSDVCSETDSIIAPAILEGRATEEAMAQCTAEFRSFDARTGTYVMYGGKVRVCPYLE